MSRKKAAGVTYNEILDKAWNLVAKEGAQVSIQQIADAADVSRQSVYLHFKTRGGLLMALVKRADERFEVKQDFDAAIALADPVERFNKCLEVWFVFLVKISPVANDLIRLRKTDAEAAAAWEDRMTDLRSWERELIVSLERDGALLEGWTVDDATDFFWASSSVQTWDLLTGDRNWTNEKAEMVLRRVLARALLK
ncbi:TetR/AcrR family transcriptional regulator [Labrenzia sp. CE80]|uniref:TetR/AcrR family transcriptional regulator n=1 Tax=Labrenzia sp. CE80 TaxID=1788986 RepID=UPI00138A03DC|nr:TetR/AcrR family transcriptional regulator [Labrenzia sp. CE80]